MTSKWRHVGGGTITDDNGNPVGAFVGDFKQRDRLIVAVNSVDELRAENEHLKAELASLTNGVKIQIPSNTLEYAFSNWHRRGYNKAKDEMQKEVDRLKAELAEAKKDADRYRFLRQLDAKGIQVYHGEEDASIFGNELDAAIDAAMKGK